MCAGTALLPGLIEGHMGKKTEGESADPIVRMKRRRVEGKEEIFTRHPHRKRDGSK